MKVLYVSGKYRDPRGPYYVLEHTLEARRIGVELWQMGYAVITPHMNTLLLDGAIPDDTILQGDIEMVKRVDGVVVCPNWQSSVGTQLEVKTAVDNNIPVFIYGMPRHMVALQLFLDGNYDVKRHLEMQESAKTLALITELDAYLPVIASSPQES